MGNRSITKRMFIGIIGVVLGFSVIVLAANTLLLKPLYYNRIEKEMRVSITGYSDVDFTEDRSLWAESVFLLNAGKSYDVVVEYENSIIFSSSTDIGIRTEPSDNDIPSPPGNIFDPNRRDKPFGDLPYEWNAVDDWNDVGDGIFIGSFTDNRSGQDFVICRTEYEDSISVYLMQPVAPISDSISQANQLLIICTAIVLVLSILFAIRFSSRFTKPIKEIQGRVEEISNLDFSNTLDISTGDELENLGNDVNILSEKLESSLEELKQKNLQLEKDIIAQKRFIANASHELRTPLSLIKGYSDELASGFTNSKDQMDSYLEIISDESDKIKRLLNEMLDLSRLESGRMELNPSPFSINNTLYAFVDKYSGFITENNLNVTLDPGEDIECSFDMMRFEQILANYFSNAAKYGNDDKRIIISSEHLDGKVKVNVFNKGNPIDDDVIENIWDGFYKTSGSPDSFGLGLSIVRAIQEVSKQEYGAENTEGGVNFWFTVPISTKVK